MSYNTPPKGGSIIPSNLQLNIIAEAQEYAITRPWNDQYILQLRFKGKFCYLDGKHCDEEFSFPLGRITYFDNNVWALAFYTYSKQRYEPCFFRSGKWFGSLEEAISICELYLV